MAKFNLKEAYRQVSVHPDDRWMLGMIWKGQLFVDTALPFGLRSAPMIFNAMAEALAYMITTWMTFPLWVIQSRHSAVITSQLP